MDEAINNSQPEGPVQTEWDGDVLVVTLNRPSVSNAMNPEMLKALSRSWNTASASRCRAVVITGSGRNFCAGADLAFAAADPESMNLRSAFHPRLLALAALDKPVIAAINGAAAGGGLSFALAADIRIMAENGRLVPAWVDIGLVPDLGASWFATRLLGVARTFDWFASGNAVFASEALELGLTNEVVSPDTLVDRAIEKAKALAAQPGNAVALTKRLLLEAHGRSLADQLEEEIRYQRLAHASSDRKSQIAARMANFDKTRGQGKK